MIQAARSGKQNIIEGCSASATSKETEIKLINVAKASLAELLEDYKDYLKTRNHIQWQKGSVEQIAMCNLGRRYTNPDYYMALISTRPPETIANIAICLIMQANYLLFKQINSLSVDFVKNGGIKERMFKARNDYRKKNE